MKIIFVDGYNVINYWETLKNQVDLDSSRKKLIEILHNYSVIEQVKITIVFDGHKVHGNLENKIIENKNITTIFTKDGESADIYIEKNVSLMGRKYEVLVVTSDSLEQQTIFQRGATRMSCNEFYNSVIDALKKAKTKSDDMNKTNRNTLVDNIDEKTAKILEAMRRG